MYVSSGKPHDLELAKTDWDFGNKSSSLLPPDKTLVIFDWLTFNDFCDVDTMRLDEFVNKHHICRIDLVHMDVQGAEMMVLKGAGRELDLISNIWLEVSNVSLYTGQPLQKDIEAFLNAKGFVKLLDTVDNFSGDQFWICKAWAEKKMGRLWLQKNLYISKGPPSPSWFIRIRKFFRIRTRLKKIYQSCFK